MLDFFIENPTNFYITHDSILRCIHFSLRDIFLYINLKMDTYATEMQQL